MIYKVLTSKQEELMSVGDPLAVKFTIDDINLISDHNQLRLLKMKTPFPSDFEQSNNLFDCANKIIHGDSIYRILEFCMLRNRVLEPHITKVFIVLKRKK